MLHSVTFSISAEKIVQDIPIKTKIVSNLIPGNLSTYIYNTEKDYYNEYKTSYFAITQKKGGWDCMRHYEIMANGCLPYFLDIEQCPENTMALLPKHLFIESNLLYQQFKDKQVDDLTKDEIDTYNLLVTQMLEYTRQYLTTTKMAKYILEKSQFANVSKILYLSQDPSPDYLRCVTLHGFKKLFGIHCHDYPRIPHIYTSDSFPFHTLYGKGITYTNLLDPTLHDVCLDRTIDEDIKRKYYDIIIYGSYHRGMPYYDMVCKTYNPNEIILLCGEDLHCCNYQQYVDKGHTVFVREL